MIRPFFLFVIVALMACAGKQQVDLIVHNAVIYTSADTLQTRQAMAIDKGKIVAVGMEQEIVGGFDAAQMVNAEQKAITAGLFDAHCHFYGQAIFSLRAELTGIDSWEKTVQKMVEFGSQGWLRGRGWDQNLWTPAEFPDNTLLDKAFPDRPVLLTRVDGHAAIANSYALQLAGITAQTQVEGGKIFLKAGKPTGLLIDNAVDLVEKIIPPPSKQQLIEALLRTEQQCFALGLTSLQDMGLDRATLELLDSLYLANTLKIRLTAYATPADRHWLFAKGKIERDNFRVIGFKVYADGALGSRGACLLEPYADDPTNRGLMLTSKDSMRVWFEEMHQNGFQVATHCIGDSAVRVVLGLYEEILPSQARWRIEHAQVVSDADLDKFGLLGIIASVQPLHATSDVGWAGDRLGDRLPTAYRYGELLAAAGVLPLGSDFPVEPINPMLGFYAAVSRQSAQGEPAQGFLPHNALSRHQTLLGMTQWAAFAAHQEKTLGTLEKGKPADFVIWERDMMKIPIPEIRTATVWATFLAGQKVFSKN